MSKNTFEGFLMHEHVTKYNVKIQASSDKSFGLVFAVVFLFIALYPLVNGGVVRMWSLTFSGSFCVFALFYPKVLAPANRLWMKFGLLLHSVVSPIALAILFFLVIMPIGLLTRAFGLDPLRLRIDPALESYWIKRNPSEPKPSSLRNQF